MNRYKLSSLHEYFKEYVNDFYTEDEEINFNIKLKQEHTKRVCTNIIDIGKSIGINESDLMLAETTALLHDIGRFEQFLKYRTFSDVKSENHAELGIKVINQTNILKDFSDYEKDIVIWAISSHNAISIPDAKDPKYLLMAKLIRDADKLDIFAILTDFYRKPEAYNHLKVGEAAKTSGFSKKIITDIMNFKNINYSDVKSSDDMKLLRLSWIYDINFPITIEKIMEKGYIEIIVESMPQTEEIMRVYAQLMEYANCILNKAVSEKT